MSAKKLVINALPSINKKPHLRSVVGSVLGISPKSIKKFIISALPYVNNQPHLGNIVGSVLGGDIYARFCRRCGYYVVYVCGTDEYGTATEMEAMKQGIDPRELVERNRKLHKEVYDWLRLKFDCFGNTDSEDHVKMTQEFFWGCYNNGYFEHKKIFQLYCNNCEQFLADRYVHGVCPVENCGYDDARGDQCDKCGHCLRAEEIREPKCTICSRTPVLKTSEHLFLRLDLLQEKIRESFKDKCKDWSENASAIYSDWMKKEIHPRSMTRDLRKKWGVPVPLKGFEDKVFYVWFDAPIGYFTFMARARPADWREWVADAEMIQFMGKDNVPFHSIIFPGMILAATRGPASADKQFVSCVDPAPPCDLGHLPLVDIINSTEYLQFNGEKFSKSRGVGIFGLDLVKKDLGASDAWRYYLAKHRPETKDSDFEVEEFIRHVSGDLIGNFGNLCNRTLRYVEKRLSGKVAVGELDEGDVRFVAEVNGLYCEYRELMEKIRLRDGLSKALEMSARGNKYLQSLQGSPDRMDHGFSVGYSLVVLLGHVFEPFTPDASEKIFTMCGVENSTLFPAEFAPVESAELAGEVTVLFTPFTDAQLANLRQYNK